MASDSEDNKQGWIPPEQRKLAGLERLGYSEMDYLDHLVERGEGLLGPNWSFPAAEVLVEVGLAAVVSTYPVTRENREPNKENTYNTFMIYRIEPTDAGKTLAEIRRKEKEERMLKKVVLSCNTQITIKDEKDRQVPCQRTLNSFLEYSCNKQDCMWKKEI